MGPKTGRVEQVGLGIRRSDDRGIFDRYQVTYFTEIPIALLENIQLPDDCGGSASSSRSLVRCPLARVVTARQRCWRRSQPWSMATWTPSTFPRATSSGRI